MILCEPEIGEAGSIPTFRTMHRVEGEGHGRKDAFHTRPWHNHSAVAGILCAATVTAPQRLRYGIADRPERFADGDLRSNSG